jgi:hypothetical protein
MIKLPINEKEFEYIISVVKRNNPSLYNKLWSYKMNYIIRNKEKNNGLS